MRTSIDDIRARWFLAGLSFADRELRLELAEGIVGTEQASICAGGRTVTSPGLRSVDVTERSRRFQIVFDRVDAHQVIEESSTNFDEYETTDGADGVITVYTRSRYLDYLTQHHGWMFVGPAASARHYQVWTYDAVIDVVAHREPKVEQLAGD